MYKDLKNKLKSFYYLVKDYSKYMRVYIKVQDCSGYYKTHIITR